MSGTRPRRMTSITFWSSAGMEVPGVTTDQMRKIDPHPRPDAELLRLGGAAWNSLRGDRWK
jgi:hypothetical protein